MYQGEPPEEVTVSVTIYRYHKDDNEDIGDTRYGKLLLSAPTTETIPLSNIKMISYFNHVRLDDDTLQLNYESTQVAQVDITTKEVDDA